MRRAIYYNNGQIEYEEYRINGMLHRKNGPAVQIWDSTGQKRSEEYYLNGKRHNEHGPAVQKWFENGQISREEYWLNGEKVTKEHVMTVLKIKKFLDDP